MKELFDNMFMGDRLKDIIEKEIGNDEFVWYREKSIVNKIRQNEVEKEHGLIEVYYILINKHLFKIDIELDKINIEKFDINKTLKIEKEFKPATSLSRIYILSKVTILIGAERLEIKRPVCEEHGHEEGFEKLMKLL